MHVTNAYVIVFLESAKTGDTGIHVLVYEVRRQLRPQLSIHNNTKHRGAKKQAIHKFTSDK